MIDRFFEKREVKEIMQNINEELIRRMHYREEKLEKLWELNSILKEINENLKRKETD